ncbi:hypothetical protein HMPREF9554_01010 [Treponema phagedenis F0421]|nr:hypothetical protein HMPREF9554_01010 [Treponema phagedenis F0421]
MMDVFVRKQNTIYNFSREHPNVRKSQTAAFMNVLFFLRKSYPYPVYHCI